MRPCARRAIDLAVEKELTAAQGAATTSTVASGQIRFRRLDGWRQIPAMLREHRRSAA